MKPSATAIDLVIGSRVRELRIQRGLTQQQFAALIGVTYQQAHKYEKGINRIAAGRLYTIAQAMGVDPNVFFEGVEDGEQPRTTKSQERLLLELTKLFVELSNRRHQEAVLALTRLLASDPSDVEQFPGAA